MKSIRKKKKKQEGSYALNKFLTGRIIDALRLLRRQVDHHMQDHLDLAWIRGKYGINFVKMKSLEKIFFL